MKLDYRSEWSEYGKTFMGMSTGFLFAKYLVKPDELLTQAITLFVIAIVCAIIGSVRELRAEDKNPFKRNK